MANPIEEIKVDQNFIFDAGKLYAKLHLAGKSQVQEFICINSGMKDTTDNDTPENPGKSTFNLNSKNGEYEICLISNDPVQVMFNLTPEKDKKLQELIKNKNQAVGDKKKEDKEILKRYIELGLINDDKDNKPVTDDQVLDDQKIKKLVQHTNSQRQKALNDPDKDGKMKETALNAFNAYFKEFAGNDYKQPQSNDLKTYLFNANVKDLKSVQVKDFKVISLGEKDIKTLQDHFYKDQTKPIEVKLGFKMKFNIQKD